MSISGGELWEDEMRPEHLQKSAEGWFACLEYLTLKTVFYIALLISLVDFLYHHLK